MVIHIYFLLSKVKEPLLVLDESLNGVSMQYTQRFFEFISELCEGKGVYLLFVSHNPYYTEMAKNAYVVLDGNLIKVREDGTNVHNIAEYMEELNLEATE